MKASKRRQLFVALAVAGVGLVTAEVLARIVLGLGDPPLSVADPEIEYLFKPGTYRRFGNQIAINTHHMRSEELALTKQDPEELRVLVLGDSVINGGALTDQADLATERVQEQLAISMGRPVRIGNVSAGSWGPGNLLAYVHRFGLFDADLVIVVLNSGDIGDNPSGRKVVGVDPNFPDQSPILALAEGWTRYVMPRLRRVARSATPPSLAGKSFEIDRAEADRSLRDLAGLVALIRAENITLVLMFSPQREEAMGKMSAGAAAIREFAAKNNLPLVDLTERFGQAIAEGKDPYRAGDQIHPNDYGQSLLAEGMAAAVVESLGLPDGIFLEGADTKP